MDNKTMARLLEETADLMEIDGADSFRIRSYRRAAEAAEQTTVDLADAAKRYGAAARDRRDRQEHGGAICRPLPRPARCRCAMSCWRSMASGFWSC